MKKFFYILFFLTLNIFANDQIPQIHTEGIAEKYVDPNMVVISVETFGRSEQAKSAQEKQAVEFQKLKKVTEKFKIKKDDIITENMSLTPEFKYDEKTQTNRTTGFRVSHQLKIILKNKDDAGIFLDSISSTGKADSSGLLIQSIGWDYDKKKQVAEQLIQDAVTDGRQKADRLANAAGVKIKSVLNISYSEPSYSAPRGEMMMAKASRTFADNAPTELGSGSIKIRTEVSLQYRIE